MRMAEGRGVGCCYQSLMCGRAHNCAENLGVIDLKMLMYLFVIFANGVEGGYGVGALSHRGLVISYDHLGQWA